MNADVNRATLDSYNRAPQLYGDRTPPTVDGAFRAWIDKALSEIPSGASVLEIGSGTGRDARYMEEAGYVVQRTEASDGLRRHLLTQGQNVSSLNALTDEIPRGYEMVFANAVLHHFDHAQIVEVMRKVFNALESRGVFVFSVKEGEGDDWENEKLGAPRYFRRWTVDDLRSLLADTGFEMVDLGGGIVGGNGEKWIQAIVRRS